MARKLVVCLDGTGNEIGTNLSNVLKLYRMLVQDEDQLVYYDPGVGTIGQPGWWSQLKLQVRGVLGLVLGLGLDDNVLDAYAWLARTYQPGDQIYLFGFSRGAYTARVLGGFIHLCGLLGPDQLNLCGYALVAYKKAGDSDDLGIGFTFKKVAAARTVPIRFIGVWDTVASLITPRKDRLYLPSLTTLPYTRSNPSVQTFRHAISIDERRRMFRLNHWKDPQTYRPDPFDRAADVPQSIRQVWFAGVHSDVGGGYPESESGLSKYPLAWMVGEAEAAGLETRPKLKAMLVDGEEVRPGASTFGYVPPSPTAELHKSLTGAWWLLEPLPKWYSLKEWPRRIVFLFFYFPWAEPRPIPNRPWDGKPSDQPFLIHSSVLARIAALGGYRPVNLPAKFDVETAAGPPVETIPPPPYREGLLARLKGLLTTWPGGKGWLGLAKTLAWLAPLLGLLGWMGGFLPWQPNIGPYLIKVALVVLIVPALFVELLFRGVLLKPPSDGASAMGPTALSAVLFALWHPLQAWFYCAYWPAMCPLWAALAWNWWFVAACAALGFACARIVLTTRSIWPAVALHWLAIMVWTALFAGPGAPVFVP